MGGNFFQIYIRFYLFDFNYLKTPDPSLGPMGLRVCQSITNRCGACRSMKCGACSRIRDIHVMQALSACPASDPNCRSWACMYQIYMPLGERRDVLQGWLHKKEKKPKRWIERRCEPPHRLGRLDYPEVREHLKIQMPVHAYKYV